MKGNNGRYAQRLLNRKQAIIKKSNKIKRRVFGKTDQMVGSGKTDFFKWKKEHMIHILKELIN